MDTRGAGLLIVAAGALLVVVGVVMAAGGLSWFGRLPGYLRIGGGAVRAYVPFASMLLVSLLLTVVAAVLRRWLP